MTTSNSDKLKLHRGSISSASVSDDHQTTDGSRYARSRLTIIPLPSTPVPSPQKSSQRPSRTSFSASSFSRRDLIPELPAYSRPLNPQQLYDLAISSLHFPDGDVTEGAVTSTGTAPIGKSCSQLVPNPKYIPVTNGVCLPFVDRKSEVTSLFQHSVNTSFSKLVEVVFPDRKQLSDFRRFVFETSREEADDQTWISTIRAILKPRSEILWTRLKTVLGVPPELDEDDPQLHTDLDIPLINDLPEVSTDAIMQPIFPDQFGSLRRLVTPPRRNRRVRADTQPIIEEVESTPTDETASSQHEQHEDNVDSPNAAGICIQTTPLFVPGITPAAPKPGMENAQYSNQRGTRRLKRHGETDRGTSFQSSGGSSPSVASYSPSSRNSRRLNPKYHSIQNTNPNRFSPSRSISTSSEVIPEGGEGNKEEEQGEKSDVSDTSSASSQNEGGFQDSRVITGTGDVAGPRKPSFQRGRKATDIPYRDLPTSNVEHPPAREEQREENHLDTSSRASAFNASSVPKLGSPALSPLSLSDNAISHEAESTGRPRFPASFSKCEPQLRSVRHPPFLPSSPEPPGSPTDTVKDMRTGHLRSHSVSYPTSSQNVDPSFTHTYPPPPTSTTLRLDKKDKKSHRAASLTQQYPSKLSSENCEENKNQQAGAKEMGKVSVEVEGPVDSVRGTVNPLDRSNNT